MTLTERHRRRRHTGRRSASMLGALALAVGGVSLAAGSSAAVTRPSVAVPHLATGSCESTPQDPHQTSAMVTFPLASYEVGTGTIKESSPTVITVTGPDGTPETVVVVGDEDGVVSVFDASTCQELPGWPRSMAAPPGQHAAIESSPTVAYLDGPNSPPSIIVGSGSTWVHTNVGEIEVFNWDGSVRFVRHVARTAHNDIGIFSTAAVGHVVTPNGPPDIVFGSWDYYIYVLSANGGLLAKYHNAETTWSSPALYQLPGRAVDDIYIGNDKTNPQTCIGGYISDFRYSSAPANGAKGSLVAVWQHCQGKAPNSVRGQSVWSSPAVGLLRGKPAVVVGTSFYEQPFGDGTNKIYAYSALTGAPLSGWPVTTAGPVLGSPAIGPIGHGGNSVIDTTFVCTPPIQLDSEGNCSTGISQVVAFTAAGKRLWTDDLLGPTDLGSPVLVPLVDHGASTENDILVGSGDGLMPIEGKDGAFLYGTSSASPARAINPGCQLFNTPAVADVVGSGPHTGWMAFESCDGPAGDGVYAYHLPFQPTGAAAWPMFHQNAEHTGTDS